MKRGRLRVYLPFTLNEIKSNMAYKGSFYLFVLTGCFGAFISYYLWMAIYGSSESGVLGGLTGNEMILYVFMTYITGNIANVSTTGYIEHDIRDGAVVMNLIKPIDYRLSLIARAMGVVVYRFFVPSIFVWIGLEIYKVMVLGMPVVSVINAVLYLLSTLLSVLLTLLFEFCFGMTAFVTTYMFGLKMAKNALVNFMTGQLIPISFFPEVIQRVFEFLPFSSMLYTPVMIYLGKYSGTELTGAFLRQIFWIVFFYLLGSFLWKRITGRLIVLGG